MGDTRNILERPQLSENIKTSIDTLSSEFLTSHFDNSDGGALTQLAVVQPVTDVEVIVSRER